MFIITGPGDHHSDGGKSNPSVQPHENPQATHQLGTTTETPAGKGFIPEEGEKASGRGEIQDSGKEDDEDED